MNSPSTPDHGDETRAAPCTARDMVRLKAELKHRPAGKRLEESTKYIPTADWMAALEERYVQTVLERVADLQRAGRWVARTDGGERHEGLLQKSARLPKRQSCTKGMGLRLQNIRIARREDMPWTHKEEAALIDYIVRYKCNFDVIGALLNGEFHHGKAQRKRIDCVEKMKRIFEENPPSCSCPKCCPENDTPRAFRGLFWAPTDAAGQKNKRKRKKDEKKEKDTTEIRAKKHSTLLARMSGKNSAVLKKRY
ncbi:MAG: uncharacterized protein A8A55_0472 [Amphiamblys sp. WSBS2006]|nr:MAG: uncharacterized protein A8A55_0472 [Amphiamblys sp. WSBS2006]